MLNPIFISIFCMAKAWLLAEIIKMQKETFSDLNCDVGYTFVLGYNFKESV